MLVQTDLEADSGTVLPKQGAFMHTGSEFTLLLTDGVSKYQRKS